MKDMFPQLMTVIHVAPNEHVKSFIAGAVHRWPVPVVLIPGGTTQSRYHAFSVRPFVPQDLHLQKDFFNSFLQNI